MQETRKHIVFRAASALGFSLGAYRLVIEVYVTIVDTKCHFFSIPDSPRPLTWKPDCLCKLLVIARVVQAKPRADQPRRSRDTAAVSPTPVE